MTDVYEFKFRKSDELTSLIDTKYGTLDQYKNHWIKLISRKSKPLNPIHQRQLGLEGVQEMQILEISNMLLCLIY